MGEQKINGGVDGRDVQNVYRKERERVREDRGKTRMNESHMKGFPKTQKKSAQLRMGNGFFLSIYGYKFGEDSYAYWWMDGLIL